ncbi:MAG: hemolysin family protein, partial [Candidatus Eremiobacterota bacterium]
VSACQVGITLAGLVLGYYGYEHLALHLASFLATGYGLDAELAHSLSVLGVLVVLTGLLVTLGELLPKSIALQHPERAVLSTYPWMRVSAWLFRPLTWVFNRTGWLLLRKLGVSDAAWQSSHVHTPEEIQILVEESGAQGLLEDEEKRLLENTLRLREFTARHAMIPRTQMFAASVDLPVDELLRLLAESPYSRLPLYRESPDQIVGVVHLKDLLCLTRLGQPVADLKSVMLAVPYVPETLPVEKLFSQLQRKHYHMAIVVDEFGGTAGMVTLEDLIERIFGDFEDEFDPVVPTAEVRGDRLYLAGDVLVEDLNEWLDLEIDSGLADSVGGLVMAEAGGVPEPGLEVRLHEHQFRVEQVEGKWVARVSLAVTPEQIERYREHEP